MNPAAVPRCGRMKPGAAGIKEERFFRRKVGTIGYVLFSKPIIRGYTKYEITFCGWAEPEHLDIDI